MYTVCTGIHIREFKKDRLLKLYPDCSSARSFDLNSGTEKSFLKSDQVYHLRIGQIITVNAQNLGIWFLTY